jgi:preprotein translocase subunit YajC
MSGDPSGLTFLMSLVMVFVVMYFMILRPQSKRQKEREAMLKNVKKGDQVLTSGGIFGTVLAQKGEDRIVVRIADNVRVEMSRAAVSAVVGSDTAAE